MVIISTCCSTVSCFGFGKIVVLFRGPSEVEGGRLHSNFCANSFVEGERGIGEDEDRWVGGTTNRWPGLGL